MRTYDCSCGATLFFTNTHCHTCGRTVGWCDACRAVTSVSKSGQCETPGCGQRLQPCANRDAYEVCNAMVSADAGSGALCRGCQRTTHAPDPSDARNLTQWRALERGKRRLHYDLALIGVTDQQLDAEPPLTYRFLADTPDEHIITGHADGVITINLAEADPVVREKGRQQFGEPQRTIIGHFRHEVGHFLWMRLVENEAPHDDCVRLFGDHENPPYGEAMDRYYAEGPDPNWQANYISQYASSHPWEDFAETCGFYLDMRAVLDTLEHQSVRSLSVRRGADLDELLDAYIEAGLTLNEINRTMGLTDLVPEVVNEPVREKLRFVHGLFPVHAELLASV
ncbi:hypothetical protein Pla123a_20570 [Posidoniimonas polymericola]|uniref:Zinc-ribbon domain-containing protein n=1 Tax=Posidoniimonas polymericola TaxID=2528002 RepID=A0A5C5YR52_9BACT|nr:putative zinc-binding metallopeptidase [Posidoniimonas polymericola]TWT77396.1 hypothetical protein Pla123a_20570 [Posidoniimonas polymericola]